jgi:hypothetical protein
VATTIELLLLARQSGRPSLLAVPFTSSVQTFSLASQVAVAGLSAALGTGTFFVEARVLWVPAGTIGSAHYHGFSFTGSTSSVAFQGVAWQTQAANAILQTTASGISALSATMIGSPTHVGFSGWAELNGILVASAPGTLAATIQLVTAGDNVTTFAGSTMRVTQLA